MLTWWIGKVRVWDIASGQEVRRFAGSKFALVSGPVANQRLLTASGDTLRITDLLPLEGAEDMEDGAAPVACFKAPLSISCVQCHGATICVGGEGGSVCILQAPFLAL